ncbi:type II toxin-antitoxin system HicB family antitoxin [Candidatus Methylomirabilis sp.]|uniref:type II toxin-antitoxin system HicB family antitoxin n=1 Tax=Candidatus Methylomirabilis sp. TaxID=2032687 RepID=UPI002A639BEA|nr:type II toxin-antitoxin system HicB family antitoxin [Candidatus Methylomirabilis sp.]
METKLKMVYWKGEKYWVGKLVDHPEIMTQGENLQELEENIVDAYRLMAFDDIPAEHAIKEITLVV